MLVLLVQVPPSENHWYAYMLFYLYFLTSHLLPSPFSISFAGLPICFSPPLYSLFLLSSPLLFLMSCGEQQGEYLVSICCSYSSLTSFKALNVTEVMLLKLALRCCQFFSTARTSTQISIIKGRRRWMPWRRSTYSAKQVTGEGWKISIPSFSRINLVFLRWFRILGIW